MESDLGTFGKFAGDDVPLDFPMRIDESQKEKEEERSSNRKAKKKHWIWKEIRCVCPQPKDGKIKKLLMVILRAVLKETGIVPKHESLPARHRWLIKR